MSRFILKTIYYGFYAQIRGKAGFKRYEAIGIYAVRLGMEFMAVAREF